MIEYTGMLSVFSVVVVHSISASGAHMKGKGRKKKGERGKGKKKKKKKAAPFATPSKVA